MDADGGRVTGAAPGLTEGREAAREGMAVDHGDRPADHVVQGGPGRGERRLHVSALAPGRFGPLPDDTLIARGLWQYAHYYDPAPG